MSIALIGVLNDLKQQLTKKMENADMYKRFWDRAEKEILDLKITIAELEALRDSK